MTENGNPSVTSQRLIDEHKIILYAVGICSASACAPKTATKKEVEMAANIQHPTGVTPWRISKKKTFRNDDKPNPCQCHDYESKQHWLLNC